MEDLKPRVLLIGESAQGCSLLSKRMEKRGCECNFVSSCLEALLRLDSQAFDLVLGPMRLRDGTLYSIIGFLEGSATTVFYSYAVEDGCWWLPALRRGQRCLGSPALRPSEFIVLLDKTIREMQRDGHLAAVSAVSTSRPRASVISVNQPRVEKRELAMRRATG